MFEGNKIMCGWIPIKQFAVIVHHTTKIIPISLIFFKEYMTLTNDL